ncbi:NeuD/PglB/VioB family sugar acetyltransferase [Undibacterium sp. Ji67W]|uniref:NeuD/PglB/VioB family sugar acetyltransferase n=1 Tax=Undibacterium sp. Ji67W TaxID=3413042 RepID=UPI003BEFF7E8
MKKIVLIGGGGFAKEVLEIAELCGHQVVGYVAPAPAVVALPYWGTQEFLLATRENFDAVCIAFGAVNRESATKRAEVVAWLIENQLPSISLVSPKAIVSKGVNIADGTIIAHGAVLSVDCSVDSFCVINTNAIIGHDTKIGKNVTIAPGAFVAGNAHIHENSLLGPGTIILESREVGANVVVGMGGTVARDVPDGATVMPVLSRVLKS